MKSEAKVVHLDCCGGMIPPIKESAAIRADRKYLANMQVSYTAATAANCGHTKATLPTPPRCYCLAFPGPWIWICKAAARRSGGHFRAYTIWGWEILVLWL